MNKHGQELSFSGPKKVLLSGTRHSVYYPPNIRDENNGEVNDQQGIGPPYITPEASEDASLMSADYLSLPNEPRNNDHIAVSGYRRDNDMVLLQKSRLDDTVTRVYQTAPREITANQQATNLVEDVSHRPHLPDHDSSPHESLEQGNSTSICTSESTYLTQHTYKRVRYAKFPRKAHYEDRLKTFKDWPHATPSGADLAEADMFYQGVFKDKNKNNKVIEDQVVCYKCGGTLLQWKERDDPLKEHKKHFPECCATKWMEDL